MLLILVSSSWVGGIILSFAYVLDASSGLLLAALFALVASALWWRKLPYRLPLCLAVLLLGNVRGGAAMQALEQLELANYNDRGLVVLRGTVDGEPDLRDGWTALEVADVELLDGGTYRPVSGAVLVRVSRWEEWRRGDRLELAGRLETPPALDGFPYREYLRRRGIVSVLHFPRIEVLARGQDQGLFSALDAIRGHLASALASALPEPQADLAQGILLGLRRNISPAVLESFSRTGMTHILAISGFNIAVVAAALSLLTKKLLRRGPATVVAIAGVATYTLLVGASPSVVRAAIMGSIVIFGAYYGRLSHVFTSLLVAAALMVLHNPLILWDVGFQLSFLATGGLGVLAPEISKLLSRWPKFVSDNLALTLAAQLATLPVVAVNFQQVSLMALPANLLALPAVPMIMLLSAAAAIGGAILPAIGLVIGWFAWLFVTYLVSVVEFLGELPWASVSVGELPTALAWAYYLGLALVWLWRGPGQARLDWSSLGGRVPRTASLVALAALAVVAWLGALTAPSEQLSVSFLNVGQGDAILVRTTHRNVLIDGGPGTGATADGLGRRLPFWKRHLDLIVLTHSDEDHVGGLVEVIRRYQVGQVLQGESGDGSGAYDSWLRAVRAKGVPLIAAAGGQEIRLEEDVVLSVLHPLADGAYRSNRANDRSVVLQLRCGEVAFLLMGDAGPEVQHALLDSGADLESTVLKVPHHGAAGAISSQFLAAVNPQVAVVSVGRDNRFGHPAVSTLEQLNGAKVYRTDVDGTVEILVRNGQCWVRKGGR